MGAKNEAKKKSSGSVEEKNLRSRSCRQQKLIPLLLKQHCDIPYSPDRFSSTTFLKS